MNLIDLYFEEFKENSDSIKKKFFAPDSDAKFKEIANLLKENQNVVSSVNFNWQIEMVQTEMMEMSIVRQGALDAKLIKLKKEHQMQKKEYQKLREAYSAKLDKNELFDKVDALENPLLNPDKEKNRQDERRRMEKMNNKLVDANLMGYEAEMYGNNIRNELIRNDEQFLAVEFNVTCLILRLFYRLELSS